MSVAMDRVGRIQAGDRRAMASLMRDLEDGRPGAAAELGQLRGAVGLGPGGAPLVVGVTGPPGSGKSTLVDGLLGHWRGQGTRVGVIAVDPTSPIHGGAILGDRIRMQRHATDPGVFIRSVATRGATGGLARVVPDLVAVLGCAGFEQVVIETVGVGQSEIDVTREADVTVVVVVPGLGDSIQALKAGLLELADVLVVNKADREGADAAVASLRMMLELRRVTRPAGGVDATAAGAEIPILETRALVGGGLPDLAAAIATMGAARLPERAARRRRRARAAILEAATRRLAAELGALLDASGSDPAMQELVDDVAEGRRDANDAAEGLTARVRAQY
jgi:LAO/AO transport system kinase